MKKGIIIFLLGLILLLLGGCNNMGAKKAVTNYLDNYRNYSSDVKKSVEKSMEDLSLNDSQQEMYQKIFKNQYENMTYKILDEKYDGDECDVKVRVTVYDLYTSQMDAEDYFSKYPDNFMTNGIKDTVKFLDYKLAQMSNQTDTVDYEITFHVKKENKKWKVVQPSSEDLQKLNGTYAY